MSDAPPVDEAAAKNRAAKAKHYVRMEERARELRAQLDAILPASGEVVGEIGCGHGHFLTAYAQAHPERVCIGLDIVSERIARANKKRERARLANLHFLRADARLFLEVLPPGARLTALYILFPDPWPKLRHHKHRIVQPALLEAVAGRMGEGGRLFFRTDYEPYFGEAHERIASHPRWELVEEGWPFEYETVFQSRAERYFSLVARVRRSAQIS